MGVEKTNQARWKTRADGFIFTARKIGESRKDKRATHAERYAKTGLSDFSRRRAGIFLAEYPHAR